MRRTGRGHVALSSKMVGGSPTGKVKSMWMRLQVLIGDALQRGATIPAREEGQTLLEYAIVIAVAVLVVLGSIKAFGTSLGNLFNSLIAQVTGI